MDLCGFVLVGSSSKKFGVCACDLGRSLRVCRPCRGLKLPVTDRSSSTATSIWHSGVAFHARSLHLATSRGPFGVAFHNLTISGPPFYRLATSGGPFGVAFKNSRSRPTYVSLAECHSLRGLESRGLPSVCCGVRSGTRVGWRCKKCPECPF